MESKENVDDSESIASDESEEMTEVDEDECDQRRAKYLASMKELEQQFIKLKEEYIAQRFKVVDQKLKETEDETAEEFKIPLNKLEKNLEFKTNFSTLMKDYRLKNIEHIYECELESDKLTLENNISSLLEKQITSIENEILNLEESRRKFQLDYNIFELSQNEDDMDNTDRKNTESKQYRQANKNVPILLNGTPYVVYTLSENEILEDLSLIKMHKNLSEILNYTES